MNKKQIRPVENTGVARADPVSDGRRQDRVFNGKRLKVDAANFGRPAFFDYVRMIDLVIW